MVSLHADFLLYFGQNVCYASHGGGGGGGGGGRGFSPPAPLRSNPGSRGLAMASAAGLDTQIRRRGGSKEPRPLVE